MNNYKNLSGRSNVLTYQIDEDFILVRFMSVGRDGCDTYKYTTQSTGSYNIAYMKQLAIAGFGLNSFISTTIKKQYDSKW